MSRGEKKSGRKEITENKKSGKKGFKGRLSGRLMRGHHRRQGQARSGPQEAAGIIFSSKSTHRDESFRTNDHSARLFIPAA